MHWNEHTFFCLLLKICYWNIENLFSIFGGKFLIFLKSLVAMYNIILPWKRTISYISKQARLVVLGWFRVAVPPSQWGHTVHTRNSPLSSHASAQLPWAVWPDLDVASFGDKRVDVIPRWATRAEHYRSPLTFNFSSECMFKGPGLHIYLLNSSSVLHLCHYGEDGQLCLIKMVWRAVMAAVESFSTLEIECLDLLW